MYVTVAMSLGYIDAAIIYARSITRLLVSVSYNWQTETALMVIMISRVATCYSSPPGNPYPKIKQRFLAIFVLHF